MNKHTSQPSFLLICILIKPAIHFFVQQEHISSMTVDEMRTTIRDIHSAQPSFLLSVLDHSNTCNGQARPERLSQNQPPWCFCSYSQEMPAEQENVC